MAVTAFPGTSLTFLSHVFISCPQVGVPYLRAKAQDYYEQLGGGIDSDILDESFEGRRLRLSRPLV